MNPYGSGLSRRGLLAVVAVLGAGGCAAGKADEQEPDDRYITAITSDPMFAWTPPGNSIRQVSYSPMTTKQPMPSRTSDVVVTYVVSDKAGIPQLIRRATDDSLTFGYSKQGLRYVGQNSGQILIKLSMGTTHDQSGIFLHFEAPAHEPQ